jgi:hypothetical protein
VIHDFPGLDRPKAWCFIRGFDGWQPGLEEHRDFAELGRAFRMRYHNG